MPIISAFTLSYFCVCVCLCALNPFSRYLALTNKISIILIVMAVIIFIGGARADFQHKNKFNRAVSRLLGGTRSRKYTHQPHTHTHINDGGNRFNAHIMGWLSRNSSSRIIRAPRASQSPLRIRSMVVARADFFKCSAYPIAMC